MKSSRYRNVVALGCTGWWSLQTFTRGATRWFVGGGHRRGTGSGSGRRRRSFPS